MNNELPQSQPCATILSWGLMFLALACLAFLAWYVPNDRVHFRTIFCDFKVDIPAATKIAFYVPDAAFPIAAGLIGLAAFTLQCFIRSKSNVALLHMLIVVLCCLVFAAYREAMAQGLVAFIREILPGSPGGG